MKQTLFTALLALMAWTAQAKIYKTIQSPETMACVNVHNGELKAREIVLADTATTVRFTMDCKPGDWYLFVSASYLRDEAGNRFPLRSAEGLKLDEWVQSPESGKTDFTMHFEPLPRKTQVFDFIEGYSPNAFMLLGIHDSTTALHAPTHEELLAANPYTVPSDWLATDSITVRGRIEGYDAETFGFTSMECYFKDEFEKDDATLVLNIMADGSFEKSFLASYPIRQVFRTRETKVGFSEIPFFARPGETIDITVRRNDIGQYECQYNSGSSREVERWLKSNLNFSHLSRPLWQFKGKFSEVADVTERTWQNMLYRLQAESRRLHFTPMEMHLALADMQVNFAESFMSYAMYHRYDLQKQEKRDGIYHTVILDSLEFAELNRMENYTALHRVDFDNPLLLSSENYHFALNRIQFCKPVLTRRYKGIADADGSYIINAENEIKSLANVRAALRELMGTATDNLMAQLCLYKDMLSGFDTWREEEEQEVPKIMAEEFWSDDLKQEEIAKLATLSKMMPLYLEALANPYIRQKAEQFCARKMAQTELAEPLPADNPSADLIRSLTKKYPGRYLVIDFWGMGCGPCRMAIQDSKALRAEVAKRDDVKLIFIAGERTTEGSDAYRKYVNEWLADEETICVLDADFTRLQELFRFNGIPHYETITPDGRRVREDLRIDGFHNFDHDIRVLLERMK